MKQNLLTCLCVFAYTIVIPSGSLAASPLASAHVTDLMPQTKELRFIENKGQLKTKDIKYYGRSNGVYLYCKPGMLSFVFTKVEKQNVGDVSEATDLHRSCSIWSHAATTARTDLVLLNSNPNAQIIASGQQEYYENFYTGHDANHGITNVHTFKTLTYKNIYPDIDMVLTVNGQGIEYSFIVHPGGKVNDIKMEWNGVDASETIEDGGIKYGNPLGTLTESAPKSFVNGKQIQSSFTKSGTIQGFRVANYDRRKDLIIDPNLVWATYFGGTTFGTGVATDDSGNVYMTGITADSTIATSGAYRTIFDTAKNGTGFSYNTFLTKFSSTGSLIWSTYFCGSSMNYTGDASDTLKSRFPAFHNITTDKNGNIFIAGITTDTTGVATSGAYQSKNPGHAAFLARFSSSGSLVWATYYGAGMFDIQDGGVGVSLGSDALGNVYLTGSTTSNSGIATAGAHQTSYAGGSSSYIGGDAFLAKFDSSGHLDWATYFGGSGYDGGYGVSVDTSQNIYLAGFTTSKGLASSGAFQTSFSGSSNAFLAKFGSTGSLAWATYFGGANGYGTGVTVDPSGYVYLIGDASKGIGTSGTYQPAIPSLVGSRTGFLAKFNGSGNRIWATYFGGVAYEEAVGVCTGAHGNVYLTGCNFYGSAIPCGFNIPSSGSFNDAFFEEFDDAGNLLYGDYIGGSNANFGYGMCADNLGNVYITGITYGTGLATSGAYQSAYKGTVDVSGDAFLAKFSNLLVTDAGILSVQIPKSTICPSTQTITAHLQNYGDFVLDSVTINWRVNNAAQPAYHWKGQLQPDSAVSLTLGSYSFTPGMFHIQAETSLPNGITDSMPCDDSAAYNVTVVANPVPITGKDHGICIGDTAQLGAYPYPPVPGIAYSWTSRPAGFTSTVSDPVATPTVYTSYYLTETNKAVGCTGADSVRITVNPLPVTVTGGNQTVCAGGGATLGTAPITGDTYFWASNPPGFISTKANPVVSPATDTTVYYLQVFDTITGCNSIPDSAIITLKPSPPTPFAGNAQTVCAGISVTLGTNAVSGNSYQWASGPAGFSSSVSNPTVKPGTTTSYYLTETLNASGCAKTDTVIITANPLPRPDAGKSQTVCAGSPVSLGYAGTTGDTYQWGSIPAGFRSTMSMVTDNPAVSSTYILAETDTATGCSNSDSVKVVVNQLPVVSAIGGKTLVCTNDSPLTYQVSFDSGSAWKWTVLHGQIVSGQGTNTVSVRFDTAGLCVLTVSETNSAGCASLRDSEADIIVSQPPNAYFKVLSDSPAYVFKAIDSVEQSYVWDFGDGATGSHYETSHQYPFTKDSLVNVSLTESAAAGCSSTFDTTIDILHFEANAFNIQVFPNPFGSKATVQVELAQPAYISISVYDVIGRYVDRIANVQQAAGTQDYEINPAAWQWGPGIYFLQVSVNGDVYVRPVVKE